MTTVTRLACGRSLAEELWEGWAVARMRKTLGNALGPTPRRLPGPAFSADRRRSQADLAPARGGGGRRLHPAHPHHRWRGPDPGRGAAGARLDRGGTGAAADHPSPSPPPAPEAAAEPLHPQRRRAPARTGPRAPDRGADRAHPECLLRPGSGWYSLGALTPQRRLGVAADDRPDQAPGDCRLVAGVEPVAGDAHGRAARGAARDRDPLRLGVRWPAAGSPGRGADRLAQRNRR